ncbi:MAG: hypothetical protein KAX49_08465 [Halanaerobiales bacterium]|nr:hypothetical protein [Halanaerobiales bacterium]
MKNKLVMVFCAILFLFSTSVNAKIIDDKNLVYIEIGNFVFNFIAPEIPEVYILYDEKTLDTWEEKALEFIEKFSKNKPSLLRLIENRYEYTDTINYKSYDNALFIGGGIQFSTLNSSQFKGINENVDEMLAKSNIIITEIFQMDVMNDIDKTIYNNKVVFTQYYKGIKVGMGKFDGLLISFYQGDINSFYCNFHSFKEIDKVLEKDLLSPVEALISAKEGIKFWSKLNQKFKFDCVTLVYADEDYDKVFGPVWEFSAQDKIGGEDKERDVLCIDALTGQLR